MNWNIFSSLLASSVYLVLSLVGTFLLTVCLNFTPSHSHVSALCCFFWGGAHTPMHFLYHPPHFLSSFSSCCVTLHFLPSYFPPVTLFFSVIFFFLLQVYQILPSLRNLKSNIVLNSTEMSRILGPANNSQHTKLYFLCDVFGFLSELPELTSLLHACCR